MTKNECLKAKVIKHHKKNLRHLETGKSFVFPQGTYQEMYIKAHNNRWIMISIRSEKCAFCKIFAEKNCSGCPIFQTTNMFHCRNTPWRYIISAIQDKDVQAVIRAEKEEITFLESLKV